MTVPAEVMETEAAWAEAETMEAGAAARAEREITAPVGTMEAETGMETPAGTTVPAVQAEPEVTERGITGTETTELGITAPVEITVLAEAGTTVLTEMRMTVPAEAETMVPAAAAHPVRAAARILLGIRQAAVALHQKEARLPEAVLLPADLLRERKLRKAWRRLNWMGSGMSWMKKRRP